MPGVVGPAIDSGMKKGRRHCFRRVFRNEEVEMKKKERRERGELSRSRNENHGTSLQISIEGQKKKH